MENILLFVFLLLIPTQLGRHFWMEWSTVVGIRSDYLSPILYLADVVWGMWVVFNLRSSIFNIKQKNLRIDISRATTSGRPYGFVIILIIIGINIWMAGNKEIAIYRWVRIIQWLITVWLLRKDKYKVVNYLKVIIPWWVLIEVGLGVAQVARNGSVQGLFYWLGERRFDYLTIGVATMSFMQQVMVRAYGTFSHPNSLAGFLLVALLLYIRIFNLQSSIFKAKVTYWVVLVTGIIGIILCGSRTIWILGGLLLTYSLQSTICNECKRKIIYVGTILGVMIIGGWVINNSGGWDGESLNKRIDLSKSAISMIKQSPLLGVGAGNFVSQLPYFEQKGILWLQPVHNVLLLGLSEIGIVGMGMLIVIMRYVIYDLGFKNKVKIRGNWMILGVIILSGMVDHYWVTLPQNMWLLAVVAVLI